MNSFFLSPCFPRTRREVPSFARRKGQACVHRSEYLNLATFARILHSTPYFFISLFPTAFYDRSRMTGRYLIPFRKKRFFCVCSYLPLPSAPLDTFPVSGDGLRFVFFPLFSIKRGRHGLSSKSYLNNKNYDFFLS